jgi:hypothetical protein
MTTFLLRHFGEDTVFEPATLETVRRGRTYYKTGRVIQVSLKRPDLAVCEVDGKNGDYVVTISVDGKTDTLDHTCTCPHAAGGAFCKHMVAATLELGEYVQAMVEEFGEDDDFDDDFPDDIESEDVDLGALAGRLKLIAGSAGNAGTVGATPLPRFAPDWRQKLSTALTIMPHLTPGRSRAPTSASSSWIAK